MAKPLRHAVCHSRDDGSREAVSYANNVRQLLESDDLRHVLDESIEYRTCVNQMRPFSESRKRGRIDGMALGAQSRGHIRPAPAAMVSAVYKHVGLDETWRHLIVAM